MIFQQKKKRQPRNIPLKTLIGPLPQISVLLGMTRVGSRQEQMQTREDSLDLGSHLHLDVGFVFDLSTREHLRLLILI